MCPAVLLGEMAGLHGRSSIRTQGEQPRRPDLGDSAIMATEMKKNEEVCVLKQEVFIFFTRGIAVLLLV